MKKPMNVVIAINQAYIKYAYVMLKSLILHHPEPIDVYVLHHDLKASDEPVLKELEAHHPIGIHYVFISNDFLPPREALAANPWGIETYFRLTLTDLLPASVDRALYIDSDMIVNGSLSEFYHCDFGTNRLAACRDFCSQPPFEDYRDETFGTITDPAFSYFNAGLTLFHLDALRPDMSFRRYMETARALNYRIDFPDQDLLNYCHWHEVTFFDPFRYNLYARRASTDYGMHYEDVKANVTVIHFATSKPWQGNCFHCDIEKLWWDYAQKTPFYTAFLEQMVTETITDSTTFSYVQELQAENQQLYQIIGQYEKILDASGIPLSHSTSY